MRGHAFGNQRINNFREWVPAFHRMDPEIDRLTGSAAGAFTPGAISPQPPPLFFFFFLDLSSCSPGWPGTLNSLASAS